MPHLYLLCDVKFISYDETMRMQYIPVQRAGSLPSMYNVPSSVHSVQAPVSTLHAVQPVGQAAKQIGVKCKSIFDSDSI